MKFRRTTKPQPQVRRATVMAIFKAAMDEHDAVDRDDEKAFKKAQTASGKALKGSTEAERQAALDALGRHGYPNGSMPL
jgi:hypothetical protein